ncbi:YfjI family protein [Erythrobacter sp. F6033]|uniref:YfjI family protein n=1 Tax=Erythrobacter sp. F6033 TaxID=2926401 RepID=UPI001FF663E6|nr:YfjI family protein [Erythrobacter sp. F6033]MCK0129761.1 YfjI family protein [Erythrobacter sp. F6033]
MRALSFLMLAAAGISLSGCLGTVADVVTAPVKVGSKAVDLATTSQSEADEKRGRELRKREEELGKLERRYGKELRKCQDGSRKACDDAQKTYRAMQELIPTLPVEPDSND